MRDLEPRLQFYTADNKAHYITDLAFKREVNQEESNESLSDGPDFSYLNPEGKKRDIPKSDVLRKSEGDRQQIKLEEIKELDLE